MTSTKQLRNAAAASLLAFSLALSGSAAVFAQDATPEATPEVSTEVAQPVAAYLGVQIENTTDGVQVVDVEAGSPADEAGIQAGDTLARIGDDVVTTVREARDLVRALSVDETVSVVVLRDGEEVTLEVTPVEAPVALIGRPDRGNGPGGDRPNGMPGMGNGPGGMMPGMGDGMQIFGFGQMGINGFLGVTFRTIDADLAAAEELSVTDGALVAEVVADSPAAAAGLLAGDIITAVNGEPVDAERTLRDRLVAYEPEDIVTLDVLRDGEAIQVEVTLGSPMRMAMGDGNLLDMFMQMSPEAMQQLRDQLGAQGFMFEMPIPAVPEATPEAGASA